MQKLEIQNNFWDCCELKDKERTGKRDLQKYRIKFCLKLLQKDLLVTMDNWWLIISIDKWTGTSTNLIVVITLGKNVGTPWNSSICLSPFPPFTRDLFSLPEWVFITFSLYILVLSLLIGFQLFHSNCSFVEHSLILYNNIIRPQDCLQFQGSFKTFSNRSNRRQYNLLSNGLFVNAYLINLS